MKKAVRQSGVFPLGDRVLLRPYREETERMVGKIKIMLPDSVTDKKSDQGKVLAVGEGRYEDGKLVPIKVKVGDIVIFSKYGYDEVSINDEELYIVKTENILAVIK